MRKNGYDKGIEEEEYIHSGNAERGCRWEFPMKEVWKVASEP